MSANYESSIGPRKNQRYWETLMREAVTERFIEFLAIESITVKKLAVVGGTSLDPEVAYLSKVLTDLEVHYFGIENENNDLNFHYLDINQEYELNAFKNYFDLVVSSQVIEHIWNHSNYFNILTSMPKKGAYLWVNCPASNLVHGSPDYYSAGMTSNYLAKNLETRNAETIVSGQLSNKRYYMATHFARYWQTPKENRRPILGYNFQKGTLLGVARKFILSLPSRIILIFISRDHDSKYEYSTEAYIGMRVGVIGT